MSLRTIISFLTQTIEATAKKEDFEIKAAYNEDIESTYDWAIKICEENYPGVVGNKTMHTRIRKIIQELSK